MEDAVGILDQLSAARLYIDRDTGLIYRSCGSAPALLGEAPAALRDRPWRELLGRHASAADLLGQAIGAGCRCSLPPFVLRRADGTETVVSALLLPWRGERRNALAVLLHPLHDEQQYALLEDISPEDCVAVLGVDQLQYDDQWSCVETARMMVEIRAALLGIVRTGDRVGLPVGTCITLVLRDVDLAGARDISCAVLSHISTVAASSGGGAAGARLCIGLSRPDAQDTPLSILLAANRALLQAQSGDRGAAIVAAAPEHGKRIAARALNRHGVFSDNRPGAADRALLDQLVGLEPSAPTYSESVLGLVVHRVGIEAAALYRLRHQGLDVVAAAVADQVGPQGAAQEALSPVLQAACRDLTRRECSDNRPLWLAGGRVVALPLQCAGQPLGYLALQYRGELRHGAPDLLPDAAVLHHLARSLGGAGGWSAATPGRSAPDRSQMMKPIETGIEGYVGDNMEGAVDQALFLARLDIPVAIVGPRGTGKMYVARIIHGESGGTEQTLVEIDCREFRSRAEADRRIARELARARGKTLVFKSPHLLHAAVQDKLARQIGSRILADVSPPTYLPQAKLVALFPDTLEQLIRSGGLTPALAGVFAGYPIEVPPIRDRKQAVLRWAHKILGQEVAQRASAVRGFTPDAEQAMLRHDWPGNISEMRQCIVDALDKSEREWLTPVDLGLFKGLSPEGRPPAVAPRPFLAALDSDAAAVPDYTPSTLESLDVALGAAIHQLLGAGVSRPLGTWLEDELVLATRDRYRGDTAGAARFLHTRPRNISRWMHAIESRAAQRSASALWREPRRLIRAWVHESPAPSESPLLQLQAMLMSHVTGQAGHLSVAQRARIMGVSTPTYNKRLLARAATDCGGAATRQINEDLPDAR
ncbi:MAG: sigma 54-interacting transcriptional regulator [Halioglobus sp.]|nr:sigma 54-interacting transcriptional regulator [Halioglobus sp.]